VKYMISLLCFTGLLLVSSSCKAPSTREETEIKIEQPRHEVQFIPVPEIKEEKNQLNIYQIVTCIACLVCAIVLLVWGIVSFISSNLFVKISNLLTRPITWKR